MTLYQFLPYPENKPEKPAYIRFDIRSDDLFDTDFGDTEKCQELVENGWTDVQFLAPVPADPEDEEAAEVYLNAEGKTINSVDDIEKNAFLAGCAHKAREVERLRKQLEESLLLYNNMTHNITTLNAENERLRHFTDTEGRKGGDC